MIETNFIVILWHLSLLTSIICFVSGLIKKSWLFLFISTITFISIALYFLAVNNYFQMIGFIPIIFLVLTLLFYFQSNNKQLWKFEHVYVNKNANLCYMKNKSYMRIIGLLSCSFQNWIIILKSLIILEILFYR